MGSVFRVRLLGLSKRWKRKLYIEIIRKLLCKNHPQKFYQEEFLVVNRSFYLEIMSISQNLENKSKLQASTRTDTTCLWMLSKDSLCLLLRLRPTVFKAQVQLPCWNKMSIQKRGFNNFPKKKTWIKKFTVQLLRLFTGMTESKEPYL